MVDMKCLRAHNSGMEQQMTELQELEGIYCEMHKDVYGVKARWYKAETVEQARADVESLGKELEAQMAQDKKFQQEAMLAFEIRVQDCISMGAKSRKDALRWIHEAEGTGGDDEYLCYNLGLPYSFVREIA